ncbi:MAG: glycosyltransferase family 2 protein [Candidatus Omnitrophica bacterium]|nr:glycosyltransferase family 2 protein [Candidatus Omnitrophota bacterium]
MENSKRTGSDHSILVIIPAFNEQASIGQVIDEIHVNLPQASIVVVNDGSKDKTAEVAGRKGVFVLSHLRNLGIGSAVQTGLMFARRKGYEIAIQVDGDGQHYPGDLKTLVTPVLEGEADLVIGSRFRGAGVFFSTLPRRIGIFFFSCLLYVLTGQWISDPTSGFRAMNRSLIDRFADRYPMDYPEPEVLMSVCRFGHRMKEVPVSMKPRTTGVSSISFFRAVYYMLKVTYAIIMESVRERELQST